MKKTNDCLPLAIGKKWNLSFKGIKCIGEVRGWKLNQYIYQELPLEHDGFSQVVAGSGCKISFNNDGNVISFASKVLKVQKEISLMMIQYPAVFNKYSLRKSDRLQASFSFKYSAGTSGAPHMGQGVIGDVSQTGFLICHLNPLREAEVISVTAPFIGGILTEQKALVRNTRQSASRSPVHYESGIEFLDVSVVNHNLISNFIRIRTADRRRRPRQWVM
jgi:hypothetical protein